MRRRVLVEVRSFMKKDAREMCLFLCPLSLTNGVIRCESGNGQNRP